MDFTTVKIPVTTRQLADVFITAFEGGIAYWCASAKPRFTYPKLLNKKEPWYAQPVFWEQGDFKITFEPVDPEDKEARVTLTPRKLRDGLHVLAKQRPDLFAKLVTPDGRDDYPDASEADAIIQLIVLQDIIFG